MRAERPKVRLPVGAYVGLVARSPLYGTAAAVRAYAANLRARNGDRPLHSPPGPEDRLLVLCPHPDDEVLALGGLLQRAVAVGARVRIVFLTHGDGFPFAAYSEMRGVGGLWRACRLLGTVRQQETRAALTELGLPHETAIFLGYPDGGLHELWLTHWSPDQPYRSRYTQADRVPYENARQPGTPYCARAVLDDLSEALRRERPTRIYAPHPQDDHGDHWATFCLLTAALRARPNGAWDDELRGVYSYLTHHGDWPVPQGRWEKFPLGPPAHLAHGDWATLPLTAEERIAKRRATARHRSQMRCIGRFLHSFLRTNELFEQLSPLSPADASLGLAQDGLAMPGVFRSRYPRGDAPLRAAVPAGDLVGLVVRRDGTRFQAVLRFAAPISPGIAYHLALHPLVPPGPPLRLTWRGNAWDLPDARGQARERTLEVHLEDEMLRDSQPLLVTAWTQLGLIWVDRICVELAASHARASMEPRPRSGPRDEG
ncbi:MAG: PIG-L family deacetylase [Armatimonadetes bacterium]|nr:PIG-L family deacetylase [Armatimonadota bacterium]